MRINKMLSRHQRMAIWLGLFLVSSFLLVRQPWHAPPKPIVYPSIAPSVSRFANDILKKRDYYQILDIDPTAFQNFLKSTQMIPQVSPGVNLESIYSEKQIDFLTAQIRKIMYPEGADVALTVYNRTSQNDERMNQVLDVLNAFANLTDPQTESAYNLVRNFFIVPVVKGDQQSIAQSSTDIPGKISIKRVNFVQLYIQQIQSGKDFYQELGVLPTASLQQITLAFLQKFMETNSKVDCQRRIMEAFLHLGVDWSRSLYDLSRNQLASIPVRQALDCTSSTSLEMLNEISRTKRTQFYGMDKFSHFRQRIIEGLDYYQQLGVLPFASTDDIQGAFVKMYTIYGSALEKTSANQADKACLMNRLNLLIEATFVLLSVEDRFKYDMVRATFLDVPFFQSSVVEISCGVDTVNPEKLKEIATARPVLPTGLEIDVYQRPPDVAEYYYRISQGYDIYQVLGADPNCKTEDCFIPILKKMKEIMPSGCSSEEDTRTRALIFMESVGILMDPDKRQMYNLIRLTFFNSPFGSVPSLQPIAANCGFPTNSDESKKIAETKAKVHIELTYSPHEIYEKVQDIKNNPNDPRNALLSSSYSRVIAGGVTGIAIIATAPVSVPLAVASGLATVIGGVLWGTQGVVDNQYIALSALQEEKKNTLKTSNDPTISAEASSPKA